MKSETKPDRPLLAEPRMGSSAAEMSSGRSSSSGHGLKSPPTLPGPGLEIFDLYRPGGRYNPVAIPGLPVLIALVGSVLAWALAWFNYSGYLLSGGWLLGSWLIWSLLTGWLAWKGAKWFKVRSPGLALGLAALGALAAWAASWPAIHYFSGSSLSLVDFILRRFEGGVVVDLGHIFHPGLKAEPDYRLFQGYYLLIWWTAGALLYGLTAGAMAARQARKPFSETSGRWYSKINLRPFKLKRADFEILIRLPKGEVPDFLVNTDHGPARPWPRFFGTDWVQISLFQDPDWQRPFINVRIPVGLAARYKLHQYRITLEEADILIEKFK